MIFPASPDALAIEIDRLVELGNPLAFCLRWRMMRFAQSDGRGGGSPQPPWRHKFAYGVGDGYGAGGAIGETDKGYKGRGYGFGWGLDMKP